MVDYSLGRSNTLRPIGALIAEIGDEQSRRRAQRIMATP
jgi:hypothetical protein